MTTRKTEKPMAGRAISRTKQALSRFDELRLQRLIKKAFQRKEPLPELVTCNPAADESRETGKHPKMESHLKKKAGPYLKAEAEDAALEGKSFEFVVLTIDKSRQSPMNKLGHPDCIGEVSMDAYWDVGALAVKLLAAINGSSRIAMHYLRVSPSSDEGVIVIGGIRLPHDTALQFRKCWEFARNQLKLQDYTCPVRLPESGREANADLKAFSRILRHPESTVACSFLITPPVKLDIFGKSDFILDELGRLEDREIGFYDLLPASLRLNGGLPEVNTPFRTNMFREEIDYMDRGCYVEIKFDISSFSKELLKYTEDGPWGFGTRKGYAEVFSGRGGMRFLNTFLGKARANAMLTPIAQAMGELRKELDVAVMPVSGAYLTYWVDLPPGEETKKKIDGAVRKRIHSGRFNKEQGYLGLEFGANYEMVPAEDVLVSDLRARFILNSLGMENEEVCTLEKADFLLNFVENVNKYVQREIYQELSQNGGRAITANDLENIGLLRWTCSTRRTIRDVEDLAWTLRGDDQLPERVKNKAEELERWVFEFAQEKYDRMFELLFRKVEREKGR
ncbi:hypothetical protein GF318_04180 [Candidatus Micrarchaeota archaeon]|nr:hypothetical protein [Candidatus Micrarchaeota archaeon]